MLSGGRISVRSNAEIGDANATPSHQFPLSGPTDDADIVDAGEAGHWHRVGTGPLRLVDRPNTVTGYLGLDVDNEVNHGK